MVEFLQCGFATGYKHSTLIPMVFDIPQIWEVYLMKEHIDPQNMMQ